MFTHHPALCLYWWTDVRCSHICFPDTVLLYWLLFYLKVLHQILWFGSNHSPAPLREHSALSLSLSLDFLTSILSLSSFFARTLLLSQTVIHHHFICASSNWLSSGTSASPHHTHKAHRHTCCPLSAEFLYSFISNFLFSQPNFSHCVRCQTGRKGKGRGKGSALLYLGHDNGKKVVLISVLLFQQALKRTLYIHMVSKRHVWGPGFQLDSLRRV